MRRVLVLAQIGSTPHPRPTASASRLRTFEAFRGERTFHTSPPIHQDIRQERSDHKAHRDFYKTHGRALFKALTLAFFTYQVVYWAWLVVETEEVKGEKYREIQGLESEVRLLDERRRTSASAASSDEEANDRTAKRLLEKKGQKLLEER